MRIATFNILSGRAPSEESVDEQKYAAAIASLDADVLGLQEVDHHQPRSGGLDLTAIAADAMGAVAHRFVPALFGTPGRSWAEATDDDEPGAPAYGIALLSRYPVTEWQVIRLPRLRIRGPYLSRGPVRLLLVEEEPRVAVLAVVRTPSGPVRVVTTHLSFLPWWNGQQLRSLVRGIDPSGDPTILTGDLNMAPARATRISGMRALASAPTFPNPEPRVQLDHLLGTGRLRATDCGAVRLPVSDHQALLAELGGARDEGEHDVRTGADGRSRSPEFG